MKGCLVFLSLCAVLCGCGSTGVNDLGASHAPQSRAGASATYLPTPGPSVQPLASAVRLGEPGGPLGLRVAGRREAGCYVGAVRISYEGGSPSSDRLCMRAASRMSFKISGSNFGPWTRPIVTPPTAARVVTFREDSEYQVFVLQIHGSAVNFSVGEHTESPGISARPVLEWSVQVRVV